MLAFALAPLLLATYVLAQGSRSYTVINRCPSAINLYIGGNLDSNLPAGGIVTRTLGVNAGFFYTDANGGNANGAATRAGFYGDNNSYYYYIVKDVNAFNTGIHIQPSYPPVGDGFCLQVACNFAQCPDVAAYSSPPTRFPPPSSTPPPYPLYACPHSNVAYNVTFCPTGSFPEIQIGGQPLHFGGNRNKCVDVRGAVFANGTPVQIYDCNGTAAQKWVFNRLDTKIRLANTNFCLDAGSSPANGVGMKIWQCIDNLPAQKWLYGNDNRIVMFPPDPSLCLDLPNGNTANSNRLQTWQCTGANPNQVWQV